MSAVIIRQRLGLDRFNAVLTYVAHPASRRRPTYLDREKKGDYWNWSKERDVDRVLRKSADPQYLMQCMAERRGDAGGPLCPGAYELMTELTTESRLSTLHG